MIARYVGWCETGKKAGQAVPPKASSKIFKSLKGSNQVSSYAREGMIYCTANSIMNGIGSSSGAYLAPLDTAQRSAMAKMTTVTFRDILKK